MTKTALKRTDPMRLLEDVPPLSEDVCIDKLTRVYPGSKHDPKNKDEPPEAANDNERTHQSPAIDRALANELMRGDTEARTNALNNWAVVFLVEVRRLVSVAKKASDWLKHDDVGAGHGDGFGLDRRLEMGPRPEHLKVLWENGTEAAPKGNPWNRAGGKLMNVPHPDRAPERRLREVGHLLFKERVDDYGRLMSFTNGKRELAILERLRAPKGKRTQKPLAGDPPDISLYGGAAIPRNTATGEVEVDFLAGKVRDPRLKIPNTADYMDSEAKHRKPLSAYDADTAEARSIDARDAARAQLNWLREFLGRRAYEALLAAVTGEPFYQIGGGKAGDKRAMAVGTYAVRSAIERLVDHAAQTIREAERARKASENIK